MECMATIIEDRKWLRIISYKNEKTDEIRIVSTSTIESGLNFNRVLFEPQEHNDLFCDTCMLIHALLEI